MKCLQCPSCECQVGLPDNPGHEEFCVHGCGAVLKLTGDKLEVSSVDKAPYKMRPALRYALKEAEKWRNQKS